MVEIGVRGINFGKFNWGGSHEKRAVAAWNLTVAYRGGGFGGVQTPPPPKFRRPYKIVPNSTQL